LIGRKGTTEIRFSETRGLRTADRGAPTKQWMTDSPCQIRNPAFHSFPNTSVRNATSGDGPWSLLRLNLILVKMAGARMAPRRIAKRRIPKADRTRAAFLIAAPRNSSQRCAFTARAKDVRGHWLEPIFAIPR